MSEDKKLAAEAAARDIKNLVDSCDVRDSANPSTWPKPDNRRYDHNWHP